MAYLPLIVAVFHIVPLLLVIMFLLAVSSYWIIGCLIFGLDPLTGKPPKDE